MHFCAGVCVVLTWLDDIAAMVACNNNGTACVEDDDEFDYHVCFFCFCRLTPPFLILFCVFFDVLTIFYF